MKTKSGREFSAANAAAIHEAHGHASNAHKVLSDLVAKVDQPTEGDDIVLDITAPDHQVRSVAPMLSPREWYNLACEVRQEVAASIPALVQNECDRQLRKARGRVD